MAGGSVAGGAGLPACGNQASQYIAGAANRKAGIACGVDVRCAPRAGDDAAGAFEDDGGLQLVGQCLCGQQALGLYLGGGALQQACGFQGVWGQDGALSACMARLQCGAQCWVACHGIECVGIQHQSWRKGEDVCQPVLNSAATTAAADDGCVRQLRAGVVGAGLHDIRRYGSNAGVVGIKQVQQCAACAVVQGGAGRENGGARHALGAANHQDIAKAAFVAVVPALRGDGGCIQPCAGRMLL